MRCMILCFGHNVHTYSEIRRQEGNGCMDKILHIKLNSFLFRHSDSNTSSWVINEQTEMAVIFLHFIWGWIVMFSSWATLGIEHVDYRSTLYRDLCWLPSVLNDFVHWRWVNFVNAGLDFYFQVDDQSAFQIFFVFCLQLPPQSVLYRHKSVWHFK